MHFCMNNPYVRGDELVRREHAFSAGVSMRDDAGGPSVRTGWIVFVERLIFLLVIGDLCWLAWLWTEQHSFSPVLFFEHGMLENLQLAILAVCVITLIFMVRLSHGVTRTISVSFLIAMVTGMVRELEVKRIPGPRWWEWLTREFSLQEILLIAGALVLMAYVWVRREDVPLMVRRSLHPYAVPLQLGALLVFIGAYVTDKFFHPDKFPHAVEELIETSGYLLILAGILRTLDMALFERRPEALAAE